MSISIIIVTYNSCGDIDACLNSLFTHSPEAEFIVVDNLSTDGTLKHVWQEYPSVKAVSAGRNGGYGAGNNIGAGIARGDYLVILNPDTEVQAGWLDPLIEVLEQRPDVGLVTPTILLKGSDERVNACGNDVHLTGLTFCARLHEDAPPMTAPARSVAAISGAAFAIRRDVWEQLGGFDERFFMYLEDTDLSLRARRLGYEILHVPASRIWHSYSVRVSATKLYHLERNRLLMLRKNFTPATLALISPALALTEALTWAFCVQQGRVFVRAKWYSYYRFWYELRLSTATNSHRSTRRLDGTLLRQLQPQLSLEQLADGMAILLVNHTLTPYYACWRKAALAVIGRQRV